MCVAYIHVRICNLIHDTPLCYIIWQQFGKNYMFYSVIFMDTCIFILKLHQSIFVIIALDNQVSTLIRLHVHVYECIKQNWRTRMPWL